MGIEFKELTKDMDFTNKEIFKSLDLDLVIISNFFVYFTVVNI